MIAGELRSKVGRVWDAVRSGGSATLDGTLPLPGFIASTRAEHRGRLASEAVVNVLGLVFVRRDFFAISGAPESNQASDHSMAACGRPVIS